MMPGGKRRPSFKMVSNMVIQLLHSIKYSVEVPFSNMAQQPMEIQKTAVSKKVPSRLKERERERERESRVAAFLAAEALAPYIS